MRDELNPDHGVTQEMREQWHKLCAIVMYKLGLDRIEITSNDIDRFITSGKANIATHPKGNVLTLMLVSDQEASNLAVNPQDMSGAGKTRSGN